MAVFDILPDKNLRAVDIRDTLLANGADWSNEEVKDANYLPNYFKEGAKINKWSRYKPMDNEDIFHGDWHPRNSKFNEIYGLKHPPLKNNTDIHNNCYSLALPKEGSPLRLGDFVKYYSKAVNPVLVDNDINEFYIGLVYPWTDVTILEAKNETSPQLYVQDFMGYPDGFPNNREFSFGFIVGDYGYTTRPNSNGEYLFNFSNIAKVGDVKKVTFIVSKEEIKGNNSDHVWVYKPQLGNKYSIMPIDGLIGVDVLFDKVKISPEIPYKVIHLDPTIHGYPIGDYDLSETNYEFSFVITEQKVLDIFNKGFNYRSKTTVDGVARTNIEDFYFNPLTDLKFDGTKHIAILKAGRIWENLIQYDGKPKVGWHYGNTDFYELVNVPNIGLIEADYYFGDSVFKLIVHQERPK